MVLTKCLIKKVLEEAEKSTHHHRVGCAIFKGKKIFSVGRNYACRSAKHLHPRFTRWRGSLHGEVSAILSARCDLKGASLLVIRINKKGEYRLAKPCKQCWAYLEFVGIKYCYYSNNDGEIIKERII
jgi:deoxycytidylate deaminase